MKKKKKNEENIFPMYIHIIFFGKEFLHTALSPTCVNRWKFVLSCSFISHSFIALAARKRRSKEIHQFTNTNSDIFYLSFFFFVPFVLFYRELCVCWKIAQNSIFFIHKWKFNIYFVFFASVWQRSLFSFSILLFFFGQLK